MKICTFNVNSVKARMDLIRDWLNHRNHDIDILCLQELKTIEEQFPFQAFEELGYSCHVFGQKGYNGVAICSKIPLNDVRPGFGEARFDQQSRIIAANASGIQLINVYAPHGGERESEKFLYKRGWYHFFLDYLNRNAIPDQPLIILGDMNVARADMDVYSPEILADTIGTMHEEREDFENLLKWGLWDVFRILHPEKIQFTWWGYMGGAIWKDEGMRIDYFLVNEHLKKKISNFEVDLWPRKRRHPTPSDHAPLLVDIQQI